MSPIQFWSCPDVSRDKDHKARPQDPGTLPLPATEAAGWSLPLCRILVPHLYGEGLAPAVRGATILRTSINNTYHRSAPSLGNWKRSPQSPAGCVKAGAGAEWSPHTVCPQQPATAETFKWLQLQPG